MGLNRKPDTSPTARRLQRLIARARAADLWERVWRALMPILIVVGLFVCVSWLGLWLEVPRWGRGVGVAIFAAALLYVSLGLRHLAPLSRRDALRRIDRASGLAHRPASVLEDRLATEARDPATAALWALHQRRAEAEMTRLRAGAPAPRLADRDRYALRAGVLVAVIACGLVAGPQRAARLAAAFDFAPAASTGAGYRVDAWIDPPAYTGKPPQLLDLKSASAQNTAHPLEVAVPTGSIVVVRASGGSIDVETSGPLVPEKKPKPKAPEGSATTNQAAAPKTLAPGDSETRLVLNGDGRLILKHDGGLRGIFDLKAIADRPPTITLRDIPKFNARGTMTLATTTNDDYGVSKAEVIFSNPAIDGVPMKGPSLVPPPQAELSLPGASKGVGDAETTVDLSDHPWAGAQVTMTLVAHDEGRNEGRSEPYTITLPQKPFTNPVARALVEQRRLLVLQPDRRGKVAAALSALMADPEAVGTVPAVYLGLRFASTSLQHAQTSKQLIDVADFMWNMALQIENGDLSEAERDLRAAEKALRDAIDRHASPEEIQRLTQNLQAAMDKFLKELAEQQRRQDNQQAQAQGRASRSISSRDLQRLIDRLKEQARSGNREEAKKALDELQDILENLKTARGQQADPQSRAMAEGMNQLDQAMRDQQDLRDETYKQGQQGQPQGQQEGQENQGQNGQGQNGQGQGSQGFGPRGGDPSGQDPSRQGQGGRPGQRQMGQGGQNDLGARQRELRDRLAQIQKKLRAAGEGQGALEQAEKAMREAEDALRQGDAGSGRAVDAQGRALESMRQGAQKLADAMQKQGDPNGQGQGEAENTPGQGQREGEQTGESDPLGRPRGTHSIDSMARFDPMGLPAAQRAQRVLDELRRRLSDPSRAQEEIDYLERLLRSY